MTHAKRALRSRRRAGTRGQATVEFAFVLPLLVLGLLAIKFVSMPLTQAWSTSAYDDGDYPTAVERLGPLGVVNWFEPYLPHLTRGTNQPSAGIR